MTIYIIIIYTHLLFINLFRHITTVLLLLEELQFVSLDVAGTHQHTLQSSQAKVVVALARQLFITQSGEEQENKRDSRDGEKNEGK